MVAGLRGRSGSIGDPVDLILARYHPDGSLNASFGAGGMVVESRGFVGTALLLQPDGKLVGQILGAEMAVLSCSDSTPTGRSI